MVHRGDSVRGKNGNITEFFRMHEKQISHKRAGFSSLGDTPAFQSKAHFYFKMDTFCQKSSTVAQHLQPFQRPALTTEPVRTPPHSHTCSSIKTTPELCPPHWRLRPKRRLREKLRDIVLKDWHRHNTYPRISPTRSRPAMMRMKDSDDYITARAANPRTGLISPSVGSITPRPTWTPETPAEALRLLDEDRSPSPTPDTKARPALRRANEGRKVSAGSIRKWPGGWFTDIGANAASPRVSHVQADATSRAKPAMIREDSFVVNMPSAREPQPYKYPGYSAKQIAAFEHYEQKARRVSGERYDQRRLLADHQRNTGSDMEVTKARGSAGDVCCSGGAELHASNFAPFASPRTPATRRTTEEAMKMLPTELAASAPLHRKPVGSGQRAETPGLRHLPQVSLVHPTRAGLRQCSLGCSRDANGGACVRRRVADNSDASTKEGLLFDNTATGLPHASDAQIAARLADFFVRAVVGLVDICKHIQLPALPRIGPMDVLKSQDTTPQQKVDALKGMLSSTGQVLVFLTVAVALWQIGSVVAHCLEIVFWPVTVPFKVLRWLGA